jgi:hypothetical protein
MVASGARQTDEWPRCGWFKTRHSRGSKIWLPARVWLHQVVDWKTGELIEPETFRLEIAGRLWTDQLTIAERFLFLRPVSLDEWRWLTARLALHGMRQHA